MTLTLTRPILVSICIAKGLAMSKLGGVITPICHAFNAYFNDQFCANLHMKLVLKRANVNLELF